MKKWFLILVKWIPFVLSILVVIQILCNLIGMPAIFCSILGDTSLLPLLFILIASFLFKFCLYHRMFIYYIFTNNIICFIDDKYEIPISYRSYLVLHLIIAAIFLFIILYLKFKLCKHLNN